MASSEGFQLKAYIAKEILGLSSQLTASRLRKILLNPKNILKRVAKSAIPQSILDAQEYIADIKERYGSPEAIKAEKRKQVEQLRRTLNRPSRPMQKREIRDILEDLGDRKSFSVKGKKDQINKILINLKGLGDSATQKLVEEVINSAKEGRVDTRGKAFKSLLRSTKTAGRGGSSDVLSLLGKGRATSSEEGAGSYMQEKTYKLLEKNFKEILEHLKKINGSIGGIQAGSSDVTGGVPDKLKRGAKGAGWLAAVASVAKKAVKVAAPLVAAYQEFGKEQVIDRAVASGLFTPEEGAAAKKKSRVQKASAAALGLAGVGVGGVMGSIVPVAGTTIGGAVGGYAGYEAGDKYGGKLGNLLYGNKIGDSRQYLATVANVESGFKSNATPSAGSARGMYQFMPETWNNLAKKYKKQDYLIGSGVDPREDNKKSIEMMKLLSSDNQRDLTKRLGRPITDVELYMAHFLGPSGAESIIKANSASPEVSAAELLPRAALSNPDVFYEGKGGSGSARTVAGLAKWVTERYGSKAAELGFSSGNKLTALPEGRLSSTPAGDFTVSDEALKGAAKAETLKDLTSNAAISSAITTAMKQGSSTKQQQSIVVSGGGGGGSGGNQSLFSDISTLHFLDGLLLNIYTD